MASWHSRVTTLIDLLNVLLFVVVDYYRNLPHNSGNGIANSTKDIV